MKEQRKHPQHELYSIHDISQIAREALLRDGYHLPMIIVEGTSLSGVIQIESLGATFDDRSSAMFKIGYHLALTGHIGSLRQLFFISEGWMRVVEQSTQPEASRKPREVLCVSQETFAPPAKKLLCFEMKRDAGGVIVDVSDLVNPESAAVSSPLMDAFTLGYTMAGKSTTPH